MRWVGTLPRAALILEPGLTWAGRLFDPLRTVLLAERERWPLWLPVLMGVGIAVYFALPAEPPTAAAFLALGLAAILVALARRHPAAPAAFAICACAIGFAAAVWRSNDVAAPILAWQIGPLSIEGRVVEVIDRAPSGATLILDRLQFARRDPADLPDRIKLTMRAKQAPPAVGARVRLLGVLMPPPPPAAPGGYDFARAAWFQRIGAVGYVLGTPRIIADAPPDQGGRAAIALTRLRHELSLDIRAQIAAPAGPIAAALLTGDRSGVDDASNVALRDAGLGHLLSISGLHMAMVAGILFFFIRGGLALIPRIALRWPIKKWAAVAALIGTFLYLLLSGMSYPAQRSFLMTAAGLGAILIDRSPISMRILAVAAAILLVATPEALLNVSFQLSFAAVAALVALYESQGKRLSPDRAQAFPVRAVVWLVASLATGLACEIALAPIAAYQFNRLTVFGCVANLVAIPLFGFWIMPVGVLALFAIPFGLGAPVLAVMGWGIDLLLALAHWVAAWPGAVIPLKVIPSGAFVLMVLGEIWFLLWSRAWRWFGIGLVAAGALWTAVMPPPDVLIARDGRLVAVRGPDGHLAFSSLKRGRFARDLWLRRDGRPPNTQPQKPAGKARCPADRCRLEAAGGQTVVYLEKAPRSAEACPAADILVTPAAGDICHTSSLVIDRAALARGGAHAIWLSGGIPRVETAQDRRGDRPWSRVLMHTDGTTRSSGPAP